jgi:hypothetical protein
LRFLKDDLARSYEDVTSGSAGNGIT